MTTWQPVDLAAVEAAFKLEILAAAADKRLYRADDPDNPGCVVYRYDERPDDVYDGQHVTDEVYDLISVGLLKWTAGGVLITRTGRAFLEERAR